MSGACDCLEHFLQVSGVGAGCNHPLWVASHVQELERRRDAGDIVELLEEESNKPGDNLK